MCHHKAVHHDIYPLPHTLAYWRPWLVRIPVIVSGLPVSFDLFSPGCRWLQHCWDSNLELANSQWCSTVLHGTLSIHRPHFDNRSSENMSTTSSINLNLRFRKTSLKFDGFWWASDLSQWPSWLRPKRQPVPLGTKLSLCLASSWSSLASLLHMTRQTNPHSSHTHFLSLSSAMSGPSGRQSSLCSRHYSNTKSKRLKFL